MHARPGASSQQEQFLNNQFMQSQPSQLSQEDGGGSRQVVQPERRFGGVEAIVEDYGEMVGKKGEGRIKCLVQHLRPQSVAVVAVSSKMLTCSSVNTTDLSSIPPATRSCPVILCPLSLSIAACHAVFQEEGRVCSDVKLVKIAKKK